ncbi:MAG: ATPase domain-containing protein [Planctomycetota bacterium]
MFSTIQTGIDGLDAILGGGIRFPSDSAAFMFVTGEPGAGKTLLGLEFLVRAWWSDDRGGRTFLFYSVEQSPKDLHKKLVEDFGGFYGAPNPVETAEGETSHRIAFETEAPSGGVNRLVLTQATPGAGGTLGREFRVDLDWIQTEVSNYLRAQEIGMVCLDNVGLLLTDLDYYEKRQALVATRKELLRHQIHSIFILEDQPAVRQKFPSAEELSTDVILHLSLEDIGTFKSRTLEIRKARHQYYYRGKHQFSIAGRAIRRDLYLGARGERGPGVHVYPSVAAQLSLVRDTSQLQVPPRGDEPIPFLTPEFHEAFEAGSGPVQLSSTVVLAEPGTRYTLFALRFLAAGASRGETGLLVSTKEDDDAVLRICRRHASLAPLLEGGRFSDRFRLLYLHPEFLSAGKFLSDIQRMVAPGDDPERDPGIRRLAFDNVFQLHRRFPLLEGPDYLIPALLDVLRYREVTPLFVDLVPPGRGELVVDPSAYLTTFDSVLHLFMREDADSTQTMCRILKSVGNEYRRRPFPIS